MRLRPSLQSAERVGLIIYLSGFVLVLSLCLFFSGPAPESAFRIAVRP